MKNRDNQLNKLLRIIKENGMNIALKKGEGWIGTDKSLNIFGDKEKYLNLLRELQKKGNLYYSYFGSERTNLSRVEKVDSTDVELTLGRFYYQFNHITERPLIFDLIRDLHNTPFEEYSKMESHKDQATFI